MKIFNWFQSKINGKQGTNKQNSVPDTIDHMLHQSCKEKLDDWPIELLAIGTFGKNTVKDVGNLNQPSCTDHPEDLTPEQVVQLHKELKLLLTPSSDSPNCSTIDIDKFFECLHNLEDKESHLKQSSSVVGPKGQDVQPENTDSGIGKKSLSYLIKKSLICRGGFTAPPPPPPPLLRDPISQSKFEKLRFEKILRAILHKKLFPQASTLKKKYLENGNVLEADREDESFENDKDGNKWDKSDSDFIVLEI